MLSFLWEMRWYFRQVAGQLALGSVAGIIMNTAVVLPAILLGVWLGLKFYGRVDEAGFRKLVLGLLVVSGVALLP